MNAVNQKEAAINAVVKACILCTRVQNSLVDENSLSKKDNSPVTIADFGAQAIIIDELLKHFPEVPVLAEEDSSYLNTPDGESAKLRLLETLQDFLPGTREDEVLDLISRGDHPGGPSGRFWTIDPIDGTKGFLRNDQYAVALALIEDGKVTLGVLGCPNLISPESSDKKGYLFYSVKGSGSYARALDTGEERKISVSPVSRISEAVFCESVESSHSSQDDSERVASILGITREPVRIDSQCKYAVLARGDASIYLRLPTRKDYREHIWDHAAGYLIVEEAGGRVTDCHGNELDFSLGSRLERNTGIIGTNGIIHEQVLKAVKEVIF